ncbi:MAG: hypothetical protein H6700_04605 [Myxococcales bacterium]|nr:hypothetical protein [Myxococcales bacterium]
MGELLRPDWMQTRALVGFARLFFEAERVPDPGGWDPAWARTASPSIQKFLAAVLVDFALADPALEDVGVCRAHAVAEEAGLHAQFEECLQTHARKPKKQIRAMLSDRDSKLAAAAEQEARA